MEGKPNKVPGGQLVDATREGQGLQQTCPAEHSTPGISADALLDRLERALAAAVGCAPSPLDGAARVALAFDADGTLWEGDVGIDLFEAFLAARGARPAAEAALRREAEAHGVSLTGAGAHDAARALYDAFCEGRYPDDRAFAMMAWAFAGWTEAEVADFAERVLEARRLEARHRAALRPVLEWARARGVLVFVVSASPRAVIERGVLRLGIPAERVLAMTPAVHQGRLLPELSGPPTYGDGKVRALDEARAMAACAPGEAPLLLAAFGDSPYDAPMLRAARVPVAVAPSPKLLALAETLPGLLVLDG